MNSDSDASPRVVVEDDTLGAGTLSTPQIRPIGLREFASTLITNVAIQTCTIAQGISETTVAGFPRTQLFGATFANTTLPAETMAPEPISMPGAMKLAAATQLPSRTVIGATFNLKSSRRKSWLPVQRYAR